MNFFNVFRSSSSAGVKQNDITQVNNAPARNTRRSIIAVNKSSAAGSQNEVNRISGGLRVFSEMSRSSVAKSMNRLHEYEEEKVSTKEQLIDSTSVRQSDEGNVR